MFPFSKPKPTRAELLKQSVTGGVNTLLEYVPAEKIETVTHKAKDLAQHAGGIASDRLHYATDAVSHHLHDVADRVREVSAHAADVAPDKFAAGADMARERATALRGTAAVVGGKLAEQAVDKAHQAADTTAVLAQAAREQAQARLQQARELAAARAEEARAAALEAAEDYRDAAADAAEDARGRWSAKAAAKRDELADSAAEARDDLAEKAGETKTNLLLGAASLFSDWKGRAAEAADDIELPQLSHKTSEVEIKDGNSKLLWIVAGVAVGVLLLLLLAPSSRRRARSMVKDRVKKLKHGAADAAAAASDKAHDLRNRADGMAHKLEQKLNSDFIDENDATLADRVRSELGHLDLVKDLERLNINAEFGTVFLRGPVLDEETQATLEKAVLAIPGVKEVKSEFLVEDAEPADASTYAQ